MNVPPVRKTFGALISLVVLAAAVLLGFASFARLDTHPRTDDAYIQADLVHMAPDVGGRILEFDVRDNQQVHRGDLLFTIDPLPYQLQVDQAAAQVEVLQAQLGDATNQVASQGSKAEAANTGIGGAEAQLALANLTLARLEPLGAKGYVPAQQVDQARTAQRSATVALQQARQQATEAQQAVSTVKPIQGQLVAAQATLALAQRNLRLTKVVAPCDGWVTGLDVSAGEYANIGVPLFTIIDTEHWYAIGNFRETDLAGLQPGQHATVYVLGAPSRPVRGTVDSLGFGVAPDEGATLDGLPRVPRSLSWVRIAQRFPVRILLDRPPPALMRIGASVVIVVDR